MDKLQLTGQNLGRVFNFRNVRVHAVHLLCYGVKLPNLKLKTRPKQLLGSLPLDIMLPSHIINISYLLSFSPCSNRDLESTIIRGLRLNVV
jgi:hypothetical protein